LNNPDWNEQVDKLSGLAAFKLLRGLFEKMEQPMYDASKNAIKEGLSFDDLWFLQLAAIESEYTVPEESDPGARQMFENMMKSQLRKQYNKAIEDINASRKNN